MSDQERQSFDTQARDRVAQATERMNQLRSTVERSDPKGREAWERTLDSLRGLQNRATARIEAAHLADDDAWPSSRGRADQALGELIDALDEIDHRLQRLAA